MLQNYKSLCDIVLDKPVFYEKVSDIFFHISSLLFLKSRPLTDIEIAGLTELCSNFGHVFPVLFQQSNITRKMHELIFNVPRLVSNYKNVMGRGRGKFACIS